MSPARRSVNPQQEALDLGLPEPAPAKTKPAKAEAAQGEPAESTAVEPTRAQRGKKATLLLSDEQLRTTAELTVRDLAAYARGEVSRAELSERAAQRASAPYRKALKTLKHSLGPAAHTMTDDALYELVDIALAARQATQAEEPARKKATRKAPAQKKTVQKAPAQKELVQNEPSPQESETAARDIPARPQKVTKASEEVEQEPAPKKSAPEIEAEKSATKKSAPKKAVAKKTVPAEKAPASKASTSSRHRKPRQSLKPLRRKPPPRRQRLHRKPPRRRKRPPRKLPRRRQLLSKLLLRQLRLRSPPQPPRRLRAVPWRATPPKTASKTRRSKSTFPHPAPRQSPRTWTCTPSGRCSNTSRANTCRAASSAPSPNSLKARTSPSSPAWCT